MMQIELDIHQYQAATFCRLSVAGRLAPAPHRGKTNSPAWVPLVAARLAELRGQSVEHIARITSDNFSRLFTKAAQS